jgi:hypothetical protein
MNNDGLPWPNPNPYDSGPIVHHSMGLPITASCDTAWNSTRVCSDTSGTEMQCLRPLRHSGALSDTSTEVTTAHSCWIGTLKLQIKVSATSDEETERESLTP